MFTKDHDERDDKMVWLSREESDQLLEAAGSPNRRLAFALGVRCGLRSEEVVKVRPQDVKNGGEMGPLLIVREGKGDKYRETPIPPELANTIETAAEYRSEPADHPIITSNSQKPGVTTRTVRRWVEATRTDLAESDDRRWAHLTFHDLRRTWATQLKGAGVDALLVCDWGGWEDLEVFLEHYRGTYAPDVQRQEREKVDWL